VRVSFILIIESICDLCRSPIVVGAYCWMNMWPRWVEKECMQNFNKDAVKISTWKSEKNYGKVCEEVKWMELAWG